jgi:two-component system OmpR family response regulator
MGFAGASAHLLVVEDDEFVQSLLSAYLGKEGFRITRASSGQEMLALLNQEAIDLILLDLSLPDEDGLTLARQVRARSGVPIVVLTSRTERDVRLAALEIGADDFLTKPFDPEELTLRLRNLLNRSHGLGSYERPGRARGVISFEGFSLNLPGHALHDAKGKEISLSPAEFNLLAALAQAPGRVLSRAQLLDAVSRNGDGASERLIDVLISRLRRKTGRPDLIATSPGLGYRFNGKIGA